MSNVGKVVMFTNITSEDFTHPWGGEPFFVKAGETKPFPFDLGYHLAKHLARKILLKNDKSLTVFNPQDPTGGTGASIWGEEDEKKLIAQILGQEFTQEVKADKTEIEKIKEQIESLQKLFPVPQITAQDDEIKSEGTLLDKVQIITELEKRNITFDRRLSKAKLLDLLTEKSQEIT